MKIKIILTDDHPMFRAGLKSILEKDPIFQVIGEANNGDELLTKLKSLKPDIVVLDLTMPDKDGILTLKEIKQKFPQLKALVLTMQKDAEHFQHAMKNGASGYLLKDDAFEQLSMAIKMIMKGRSFISTSVEKLVTDRYIRSIDDLESASLEILTKRELEILKLITAGLANKAIASKLKISIRTVETHRAHLSEKLGIKNTANLVKYALSKGLL